MDVASWLRDLGLERYEATFRENGVSAEVLSLLTADDLKELALLPSVIADCFRRQSLNCRMTLRCPNRSGRPTITFRQYLQESAAS